LEPLRGDRKGHYSIRINDQWRICFEWPKGANGTVNVEITDYHWGGKHMARTAIHPGEHLAEELKALGMSAAALSRDINVPVNRITGIINGMRAITADTAIRLGHWFGTSAEFWLNLQKLYELRRAHADVGAAVERLPSLGTILREGRTRPGEDAPPHVQPHIIAGSTKKMHATTDDRASTTVTKARRSGVHKRAKRATQKAR
jgi:addiction module HigA family antidote